jgi:hypothetical protein
MKKGLRALLLTIMLVPILIVMNSSAGYGQSLSKKDLIGKWQSTNGDKPFEMTIADSLVLYFKADGTPMVNNMALTYTIDSIKNESILNIHFPTGFNMKLILRMKSLDEIRLFDVDLANYKDPLKDIPDENSKKVRVLKRVKNVI